MPAPDFSESTKRVIRERADNRCSAPACGVSTVAPDSILPDAVARIGEVAHIKAARSGEARYDATQTDEERSAPENAILLCRNCHTKVDANLGNNYSVMLLLDWKARHECQVRERLGRRDEQQGRNLDLLIQRMRDDLKDARELLAYLRSKNPGSAMTSWVVELQGARQQLGVRIGIMQDQLHRIETEGYEEGAFKRFGYAKSYAQNMRVRFGM